MVDEGDAVAAGEEVAKLASSGLEAQRSLIEATQQSVSQQIEQLSQTSNSSAALRQQLDALRSRKRDIEAQLAEIDTQLDRMTLVAPWDGVVVARLSAPGAVVNAGVPILRIVDLDALEIRVAVPRDLAVPIAPDELAERLWVEVAGSEVAVESAVKLPVLDRNARTQDFVLRLQARASEHVVPGQIANVKLSSSRSVAGYWVPHSALTREIRGLWSVFAVVSENGEQRVSRRYVDIVHLEQEQVLVKGSLDEGELVIARGLHRVVPGQAIVVRKTAPRKPGADELSDDTAQTKYEELGP